MCGCKRIVWLFIFPSTCEVFLSFIYETIEKDSTGFGDTCVHVKEHSFMETWVNSTLSL